VRDALVRLIDRLARAGLEDEGRIEAELVLAEAMNNIVEHAYRSAADGWIRLEVDLAEDRVHVRLEDGGAAMPGLAPPPGEPHDLDVPLRELPEGGFGWVMIRRLATDLAYERLPGRNRLCFAITRRAPGTD
jgi:serine/threonine-protein kinase RsbW